MKLWGKISLICSAVLVAIVAACSTLLLVQSKTSILELTYQQARDKQRNLASSFSTMASYYTGEADSSITNKSLVKYCFSRFADSSSVLLANTGVLYSEIAIAPEDYLSIDERSEQQLISKKIDGRNILIVGSLAHVKQADYRVFVVEDISVVYNNIASIIWRFVTISATGVSVGVTLISLLVRRSMQPLRALGKTAKRIALGNYGERAVVLDHDEVGELAGDFNAMASAVENHVEQLTDIAERQQLFIGGVTHEFKTPLTTMILNADTLQNAYMKEEEIKTAAAYIQRQCQWLERLTQKLLKLITLKRQIKCEDVALLPLFERALESMAEILEQRGTPVYIECETHSLELDADLMQSVIVNLLDNASKASKKGQSVRLAAYDDTIEVSDHGCGIRASELARITEPFYMVDQSRSKKYGGSGLGLALVKAIVAAHQADLRIESEPNTGTTIRIRFGSNHTVT